jgi:hypothetical protein
MPMGKQKTDGMLFEQDTTCFLSFVFTFVFTLQ